MLLENLDPVDATQLWNAWQHRKHSQSRVTFVSALFIYVFQKPYHLEHFNKMSTRDDPQTMTLLIMNTAFIQVISDLASLVISIILHIGPCGTWFLFVSFLDDNNC